MDERGFVAEIKNFFSSFSNSIDLLFEKPLTFVINVCKRILSFLILFAIVFIADSLFKWTDHFAEERKLDRYQKIQALISNKDLNPDLKKSILELQYAIINEKNYKDVLHETFNNVFNTQYEISIHVLSNKANKKVNKIFDSFTSFNWLHFITSSWLLCLLIISMSIQLITGRHLQGNNMKIVGIILILILVGLCFSFSNILLFINPFSGKYAAALFNLIAHALFLFAVVGAVKIASSDSIRSYKDYAKYLQKKY